MNRFLYVIHCQYEGGGDESRLQQGERQMLEALADLPAELRPYLPDPNVEITVERTADRNAIQVVVETMLDESMTDAAFVAFIKDCSRAVFASGLTLAPPLPAAKQGTMATRILVVDDDPVILEVLRLTLQRAGYEVQTALDGEEALQLLSDHSRPVPHVIITDARMPRRDGPELLRTIEPDPRLQGVRTILMSSDPMAGKEVRCHAFVEKERLPYELVDTLVRVVIKPH
jgi:two-component system alkaline phosphatase synthesis response regulator PhoP